MTKEVEQLLQKYVDAPVECDGFTRIAYSVLTMNGIESQPFSGYLTYSKTNQSVLHFWLKLSSGEIVDYRARMWFGEIADIPHGIFDASTYPLVFYDGNPVYFGVLHETLINWMCAKR